MMYSLVAIVVVFPSTYYAYLESAIFEKVDRNRKIREKKKLPQLGKKKLMGLTGDGSTFLNRF